MSKLAEPAPGWPLSTAVLKRRDFPCRGAAVGFVHSIVERPSVDGRELRLEYLQATGQPHPLRKVLDYHGRVCHLGGGVWPRLAWLLFA